ncbi:MAG: hypothetical protein ACR2PG_10720, partial [Hyphomicrobiaceae bacterium]
ILAWSRVHCSTVAAPSPPQRSYEPGNVQWQSDRGVVAAEREIIRDRCPAVCIIILDLIPQSPKGTHEPLVLFRIWI